MSRMVKKIGKFLRKRKKILLVFLIACIVFVSFSSLVLAENNEGEKGDPSNWIYTALGYIGYAILWIVGWFLALCAKLLNATLDPALYNFMDEGIVQVGWTIVRDVCNLFFILILLIIAFATILRLETYDIKRMLPKLLIIALFINFSKMICGLIIDFSQVLMNTFLNAMDGPHFSDFIANKSQVITSLEAKLPSLVSASMGFNANLSIVTEIAMSIIFFLVMGIIFLILGVLLLIRIVALWVLIILAPLAWLIGIIPSGKKFADQWWSNFIKYCFFGPIMAFFLYLSYRSMTQIEDFVSAPAGIKELGFLGNTAHFFLVYVTIMILLIASVVVSKTLGIAGAGFMIGGAQKLAGWGVGKITRAPRRAIEAGVRGAGVKLFGKTLGKIPGLGGVARRMKAVEEGRKIEEARKDYGKYYTAMSPKDLMESAKRDIGIKGAIAAEVALGRGLYGDAKPEQVERAKTTFERFGQREQLRTLEEQQPDIAKDTNKVIERIGSGGIQKLSASALTPKVMKALQAQLTTSQFAKIFKGWAKRTRDAAEEGLQKQFSADFGNKDNIKARKYFAKATGRPTEAFYTRGGKRGTPEVEREVEGYVRSLKSKDIGGLNATVDLRMVGRHGGAGQLVAAGAELSERQKEEIRNEVIRLGRTKVFAAIQKAETWA